MALWLCRLWCEGNSCVSEGVRVKLPVPGQAGLALLPSVTLHLWCDIQKGFIIVIFCVLLAHEKLLHFASAQ